jgi:DNA-binding beta-propeller fold protein YncE
MPRPTHLNEALSLAAQSGFPLRASCESAPYSKEISQQLMRRHLSRPATLFIVSTLVLLSVAATPPRALAAASHTLVGGIGSFGPLDHLSFEDPCGVAVDSSGRVAVADYYHNAIEFFSPQLHDYLNEIAGEDPTGGPCKLAFDNAGDLYVNNWHQDVERYALSSNGGATVIDPNPATGLAFDPKTGNLYVDQRTFVAEYQTPVQPGETPIKIGLGNLADGYGVAVSDYPATAGYLYVPDAATGTVKVYDPASDPTNPVATLSGSATPQEGFRDLVNSEVAVDASTGHVYVLDDIDHLAEKPEAVIDEFNAGGDYRGQITAIVDAGPSGMAIQESTDRLFLTSGNSEHGSLLIFSPTLTAGSISVSRSGTGAGAVKSVPAGINCGDACSAEFNYAEEITLYAYPDAHSIFKGWTASEPEACTGAGDCSVRVNGSVDVQADFEAAPQLPLHVSAVGQGTVSSEPQGISCPGHCSEEFATGERIYLTARPGAHQEVVRWSGCSPQEDGERCVLTLSEGRSASVEFSPIPQRSLGVSVTGPGEVDSFPAGISCPGSCVGQFDAGSTVYLIPSADLGAGFRGWRGAGCRGTGACGVSMSEAQSVLAEFLTGLPPVEAPPPRPLGGPLALRPASISLRRVALKRGIALAASVSDGGRVSILNRWLRLTEANPSAAGVVRLPLALNGAGRGALRKARGHRLRINVTVFFTPSYRGPPATATETVTFRARRTPPAA